MIAMQDVINLKRKFTLRAYGISLKETYLAQQGYKSYEGFLLSESCGIVQRYGAPGTCRYHSLKLLSEGVIRRSCNQI